MNLNIRFIHRLANTYRRVSFYYLDLNYTLLMEENEVQ